MSDLYDGPELRPLKQCGDIAQDGEKVTYRHQGLTQLEGHACLDPQNPGIRCSHCDNVVSPSQFENHAGYGSKR